MHTVIHDPCKHKWLLFSVNLYLEQIVSSLLDSVVVVISPVLSFILTNAFDFYTTVVSLLMRNTTKDGYFCQKIVFCLFCYEYGKSRQVLSNHKVCLVCSELRVVPWKKNNLFGLKKTTTWKLLLLFMYYTRFQSEEKKKRFLITIFSSHVLCSFPSTFIRQYLERFWSNA